MDVVLEHVKSHDLLYLVEVENNKRECSKPDKRRPICHDAESIRGTKADSQRST